LLEVSGAFWEYAKERAENTSSEQKMASLGFTIITNSLHALLLNSNESEDGDSLSFETG